MNHKIILFIFILTTIGFSQNVRMADQDANHLRKKYIEAVRYENQNQSAKALKNYRYLFQAMPQEKLFYSRYFDLLFELKKHEELAEVLPQAIAENPQNDKAKIDLGKLYFLQEDTVRAHKTWQKSLRESNYSKLFSRHLFYTLISLKMREEAEAILLKSRKVNKDENLFNKDLGDYYFSNGEYKKSIAEYIKYLAEDERNFSYVSEMIINFPKEKKVVNAVDSTLIRHIQKTDAIPLHNLRSDYLFFNNRMDQAAHEIFYIEQKTGYTGNHLLPFCENLIKTQQYAFAKQVCTQALKKKQFEGIYTNILLILAKVEEKFILKDQSASPLNSFLPGNYFFTFNFIYIDDEKSQHLARAFQIYDSLSTLKNNENISGEAEFNIANLRYFYVRDYDGAIANYNMAAEKSKSVRFRHQCFNNKLLATISQGKLQEAANLLERRKKRFYKNYDKDYLVNRILIDFLNQDFEKVLKAKDQVMKQLGFEHWAFNDYFELLSLIKDNYQDKSEADQKNFKRFVTAELMLWQSKLGDAVGILDFILSENSNSPIADEALLRGVQIYLQLDYDEKATEWTNRLMKTKSDRRDMAARIMADYYFSRGNMEKAREWYQTILLDFPNSFYIETARNRLRQIRGDNL